MIDGSFELDYRLKEEKKTGFRSKRIAVDVQSYRVDRLKQNENGTVKLARKRVP